MQNYLEIVELLQKNGIAEISINEPLKKHTSIKVGGNAKVFVQPKTIAEAKKCVGLINENKSQYYILGQGTNLLVGDSGFDGVIICLKKLKNYKIFGDGIYAEAGLNLFELNKLCKQFCFGGLEFSYGIPASVGGAVVMNAGTQDNCIGNFVEFCLVLKENKLVKVEANELDFSYRHSIFQTNPNLIILGVKFKLSKAERNVIENLQQEIFQKKLSNQPYGELSFGSAFKRNADFPPVSKLIDQLGLKGKIIGGAKISEKHAGFIINYNQATCKDCLKLLQYIKEEISSNFGFKPEFEVRLLGVAENDFIW